MAQQRDTSVIQPHEAMGGVSQSTSVVKPQPLTQLVSFDVAYKQLMERWEDPHMTGKVTTDAGGATRYGISQRAYPSLDIATISATTAKQITEHDYWNYGAWDISKLQAPYQPLANKLFQFGFNVGVGTVIQISNSILSVIFSSKVMVPLGKPLEVTGLNNLDYNRFLTSLAAAQLSRYVVDYHGLSRVPHSLMDRALCIE